MGSSLGLNYRVKSESVDKSAPKALLNNRLFGFGKSCTESEVSKLLGITWNSQTEEFLFCFSELIEYAQQLPVTKRSLLKVSAKLLIHKVKSIQSQRFAFKHCVLNQLIMMNHSRAMPWSNRISLDL